MAAFMCDFPADDLKPMCQVGCEVLTSSVCKAKLIHQDCEGRNRTGSKTDLTSHHSVILSAT